MSIEDFNKGSNCCRDAARASLCYRVKLACTSPPLIQDVVGCSGSFSLTPGPVTEGSALACGCCTTEITIPSCETYAIEQRSVPIEARCQTICRNLDQCSQQKDCCDACKSCCILTTTSKKASASAACPGGAIAYTITFTNHSPIALDMIWISDAIPAQVTIIPGSIHPAPGPGETLQSGISMGGLAAGQSAVLTYTVIVNSGPACTIANCACARYFYTDCSGCCKYGIGSCRSCVVRRCPGRQQVAITKFADKKIVCHSCEEIAYSLVVSNPGQETLTNVVVYDDIPEGLCYKTGSTIRNGGTPVNENPQSGLFIGSLKPGEAYSIAYVLYVCINPSWDYPTMEFVNTASIKCRFGHKMLSSESNPWTVLLKGRYPSQCVVSRFPVCGFARLRHCFVYHRGLSCYNANGGRVIYAKFGIAIKYEDFDGKHKSLIYESGVLFDAFSVNFDPAHLMVRFSNLVCNVDENGNLVSQFVASLYDYIAMQDQN